MVCLVSAGRELGGDRAREAASAFADALYRKAESADEKKLADRAAAGVISRQAGMPGLAVAIFREAVAACQPSAASVIDAAVQEEMGAHSGGLAVEAALLPASAEPRLRDVGGDTFATWSVRRGGEEVLGRDPFEGPAARKTDAAGRIASEAYFWNGERLGSTLALALETFREGHPAAYDACARRFAHGANGDPAQLPAPLRDVLAGLPAEARQTC
jgi:hypothetical protein